EFQKSVELNNDPYSIAMLGHAYARNRQPDETRKILTRLNEEAKSRYVSHYALAQVFAGLGDKERAIDELERTRDEGPGSYFFTIKVDPALDVLRGDPRFEALVREIVETKK